MSKIHSIYKNTDYGVTTISYMFTPNSKDFMLDELLFSALFAREMKKSVDYINPLSYNFNYEINIPNELILNIDHGTNSHSVMFISHENKAVETLSSLIITSASISKNSECYKQKIVQLDYFALTPKDCHLAELFFDGLLCQALNSKFDFFNPNKIHFPQAQSHSNNMTLSSIYAIIENNDVVDLYFDKSIESHN